MSSQHDAPLGPLCVHVVYRVSLLYTTPLANAQHMTLTTFCEIGNIIEIFHSSAEKHFLTRGVISQIGLIEIKYVLRRNILKFASQIFVVFCKCCLTYLGSEHLILLQVLHVMFLCRFKNLQDQSRPGRLLANVAQVFLEYQGNF